MLAAPLLAGYDLSSATPASLGILGNEEVIAVDQDRRGRQGRRVRRASGVETWVRQLADGSQAVLFLNRSGSARRLFVKVRDIPRVRAAARYSVRDLWTHTTVEVAAGRAQQVDLASHEAVMWRVTPG
jgi:alpha-galactosidase